MLFGEIEPFADAHIDLVEEVQSSLEDLQLQPNITEEQSLKLEELTKKLNYTLRAFDRFKACAIDEWQQKERLQKQRLTCRLTHK